MAGFAGEIIIVKLNISYLNESLATDDFLLAAKFYFIYFINKILEMKNNKYYLYLSVSRNQ